MRRLITGLSPLVLLLVPPIADAQAESQLLQTRIKPPTGYKRIAVPEKSFGAWLRKLPLRPGNPGVRLFDGRRIRNRGNHCAVVDMDIGSTDLQQCADVVIRLRAEYLRSADCGDEIHFNFTSGDSAFWKDWRQGSRPLVKRNSVIWRKAAAPDTSYDSFQSYLDTVFMYAGSMSLSRELVTVMNPAKPEIGDVFILGGFPGHAMIVVDVAEDINGRRVFLLAQGLMPAQDMHILRSDEDTSPWFTAKKKGALEIPATMQRYLAFDKSGTLVEMREAWPFEYTDLKRFVLTECETAHAAPPSPES
ncbi:MAG: DUF4846 domain-containing protein [Candidatus Zixiibacteriota bacterium]|nr:MAG: DUF4846 domain-containing protein [candidate division Zixibacteria bacterium]